MCVAVFQKRIGVQAVFFMLAVELLSIDCIYFPLKDIMFYCIYYVLAFGQYLKHSCHSALELIISELNPEVAT